MATQASESSQALTEVETSDRDERDESPEARHIRDNGLAAAPDLRERFANGEARPTNGRISTREQPEGNVSRDVSRAMVNLLKDYIGRGASHARAYVHEDLVVVVLHGTMTKAERTLADEGEEDLVRGVRQVLQGKFREDANGTVERLTGQHVAVFLSDHNVDEDVVIQAFVLEPRSTSG
jgi:uncharacterized protein YbcI